MATINPLQTKSRTVNLHSTVGIQDENKVPASKTALGGDKKTTLLKSTRGALSDLTNNTIVSTITGKLGKSNSNIVLQTTQPQQVLVQPQQQQTNVPRTMLTRSKTELMRSNSNISSSNLMPNTMMSSQPQKMQKLEHPSMVAVEAKMYDPSLEVEEEVQMTDDIQMMDQEQPENIDIYDAHDPQCVGEYVNEIFAYYREKELIDKINPNYLKDQYHINEKMRAILVDWMMAVHVRFKMLSETFFLSVNIVDRYLSKVQIPINKLQLVGITSMLLAAKYEEIYSPQINDFIITSDNACTHAEVLGMERLILSTLQFHVSTITPLHFLRRFSKAAGSDSRTHSLSKYLTELCMLEYKLLKYTPSMMAAASIYVARRMTMKSGPYWNVTLEFYTCYKESDIMACAQDIKEVRLREESTALRATKKKYLSQKLMEVAAIPPVEF